MDSEVARKISAFFETFPVHQYDEGEILIQAGDNPESILQLVDGRIKMYDISFRGDEVVLNVFSPPAFFPMSFAINHTPNKYFFEAETDVTLRAAPPTAVVEFIKANPDVLFDLLARVYRGTDGLIGRIAHLMASSAKSRVMYELLIEGRRFGKPSAGGVVIKLNESDIGSRSGLARETVNREMQKLKKLGLITIAGHELTISDLDQIADLLSQEL